MDCYWCRRLGSILYQWDSSRLFISRGENMFPLCIKSASLVFLTVSQLLRMSWSGIKMMSLIERPAWLECKETGVWSLSRWWFKMDRRCSPNRSLSWRLVFPMYWHPAFTFVALHHCFWATYRKVLDKNCLDDLAITYSALQSKPWNRDSLQPVSLSRYMSCPLKSSGIPED